MANDVTKQEQSNVPTIDLTLVSSMYQTVANRRQAYDTLMWQVPALSLTAQAFLFTIALGKVGLAARLISCSLALGMSLMSMQLMSKHRYHEKIDSILIERLVVSPIRFLTRVVHSKQTEEVRDEREPLSQRNGAYRSPEVCTSR